MKTRRIQLIVAIVLALGTGLLALQYLTSHQPPSPQQVAAKEILVAGQDIPARSKVTRAMLRRTSRPANEVEPDAIVDQRQVDGTLAMITIPTGGTITTSKVGRPADVGLPVRLQPGQRAVTISVDKIKGVAGLLQPGDKVDVIAIPARDQRTEPHAYTIIRGAVVLAINAALETAGATPAPESQNLTNVTLAVTPEQADLLALADLHTTLRLALRSPREPVRAFATEPLHFPIQKEREPPKAPAPPPIAAVAPGPVPTRGPIPLVTLIEGDKVTEQALNSKGQAR